MPPDARAEYPHCAHIWSIYLKPTNILINYALVIEIMFCRKTFHRFLHGYYTYGHDRNPYPQKKNISLRIKTCSYNSLLSKVEENTGHSLTLFFRF